MIVWTTIVLTDEEESSGLAGHLERKAQKGDKNPPDSKTSVI